MATRKYVTDDGSIFDDKAAAHSHECRTPILSALVSEGLAADAGNAESILQYFEKTFRVPAKRGPRKPKGEGTGGTGGGSSSAGAATAPAAPKGKK